MVSYIIPISDRPTEVISTPIDSAHFAETHIISWLRRYVHKRWANLKTNTLFTVSESLSEPRSFFTPPLFDLLKFGKQRMPIRSRSKTLVARISREFLSCLGTAFRSCLGTLPPRLRLRHITILAEGLARHPALLPQIGPGLSLEDAYLFRSIARDLLRDQLRQVFWQDRLLWVLRFGDHGLSDINRESMDTLCDSLLATAIRYRTSDYENRLYCRSMITFGLACCIECLDYEGSINVYTELPELDIAKVNEMAGRV